MAENAVATPSKAHQDMQPHWRIIDAVRGGTPAMRDSSDFLPKEPMEEDSAYKRRKNKTTFTPWYERLVSGLVGMVLRKPVGYVETPSDEMAIHLDDLNRQGDNLQMIATDLLETALDYGYAGIFVDYPDTKNITTLRDEKENGIRPYWVLYRANEIIGYRTVMEGGAEILTQLRVLQTVCEEDGEFGDIETQQVRVYIRDEKNSVTCTLYRPIEADKPDGDWAVHEGPMPISLPVIPCTLLSCINKKRVKKRPPMLEVAYLNLKHYQLSSDLDHALHLTMHPKLALFGYEESTDVLGTSDEALVFTKTDARAEWLVCRVDSLSFGSDRIGQIEQQMATLGLSTLTNGKNVGESAEAKRIDRSQGDSIMSGIAQNLQNTLNNALAYHAAYLGVEPVRVMVSRDFDISQITPEMLTAVVAAVAQGRLSTETFHEILKRGELGLDNDWTPQLEQQRMEAEFKKESTAPVPGKAEAIEQPL
jgi:Domain of unknown function (DUF4055)